MADPIRALKLNRIAPHTLRAQFAVKGEKIRAFQELQNALNDRSKPLNGSHIHIPGVAYKRNIDHVR
jgi:hypothetical protein